MNTIPFLDLGRLHQSIRADLDRVLARVVNESAFIGGAVPDFEAEFASSHGLPAAAGCGSGTDALALALRGLGVGPGDEVIVPSMTFVATAEAVVHAGATPVIADVHRDTLLLTEESVAEVATSRTRAVIPVHLYGHLVPFDLLAQWRADGLIVVEDAAQAHLGEWQGRGVGSVGHAACFSFYPGKNLGALGDGGLVASTDEDLIANLRCLRDHGRSSKYVHEEMGWCSRLDGLQAAVLQLKLAHLPRWTDARRSLAARYQEALGDDLVSWEPGAVHHLLVARARRSRDEVVEALEKAGVGTGIHYPVPLSQQPSLRHHPRGRCGAAELAAGQVVSLPIDPLMTLPEVERVCDVWLDVR